MTTDKNIIFADYWSRSNFDPIKPYAIYAKFIKYFTPITPEIINYVNKYGIYHRNFQTTVTTNIMIEEFCANQFDLIQYTEDQVRRLQDYVYTNGTIFAYTKYNFNFDQYSVDFNIFGPKLLIFTDFIIRNVEISGVVDYTNGYSIGPAFIKYFITSNNLLSYLNNYAVTSISPYAERNFFNIDWNAYIQNNLDLPRNMTIVDAQEHYLTNGQFEQRQINFIEKILTPIQNVRACIATIFLKNKTDSPLCTGFLYDGEDNNKYIITVHHIIEQYLDQRYIYAILENGLNCQIAQFVIIGYDAISDVMVALYDCTLNYNIINNVDLSGYSSTIFATNYLSNIGDTVSLIGDIGLDDNLCYVNGKIMNTRYSGGFSSVGNVDTIPESCLIQTFGAHGMSGSPVLIGDPQGLNELQCIGMLIGSIRDSDQIMMAIDIYLLDNIIDMIIRNWFMFTVKFKLTSQNEIDTFVKIGYPKAWLGITNQYYHPILVSKYKELSNLPYVGGLLITNFIIGFNIKENKLVYSSSELIDHNVIALYGPLLKSTIYKRFTINGNIPIVIKSINYFDSIDDTFNNIHLGKFGTQKSYSRFVYGQAPIASYTLLSGLGYYNPLRSEYGPVTIEYYYYNGNIWILDSETVGGNDDSWYNTYKDNAGNLYHQHLFEFPQILIPYIKSYSISKFASGQTLATNLGNGIIQFGNGGSLFGNGYGGSTFGYGGSNGGSTFGYGGSNGGSTFGYGGYTSR